MIENGKNVSVNAVVSEIAVVVSAAGPLKSLAQAGRKGRPNAGENPRVSPPAPEKRSINRYWTWFMAPTSSTRRPVSAR